MNFGLRSYSEYEKIEENFELKASGPYRKSTLKLNNESQTNWWRLWNDPLD